MITNDTIYTPTHQGRGIAFCSKCDKSFIDNNYYEFCPRCGCRIRYPKYTLNNMEKHNDQPTETTGIR